MTRKAPARPDLVVVGAGIAGLTAALRARSTRRILVLEAGSRAGGQLWTAREAGFVVERGAEGFVARSQAVRALAREVGLAEEVIEQSVLRSYGYDGHELRVLAPGEAAASLGFQVPPEDLGRGIRSLRSGMDGVIAGLERTLAARGAEVRLDEPVERIEARADGATVFTRAQAFEAGAVVLATSAAAASILLAQVVPEEARALASTPALSSVTVELAYERAAVEHALDATGFVVALDAQRAGLRACTFSSAKFSGRAPADHVSLRLFFRPAEEDLLGLDDAAWQARAVEALERVMRVRGAPLHAWITRWPRALPVLSDAARAGVAALERALARYPVWLAGSAFHGSGIDAAVRSGQRAGEQATARLRRL